MATESTFVYDESFPAGEDLSSYQYYIVTAATSGYVQRCISSTGDAVTRALGVLQNNPTSGHAAIVRLLGKSKVVCTSTAAATLQGRVSCSTAGTAMLASTGSWVLGHLLAGTTGGTSNVGEVLLLGPFTYVAGATA